MKKLRPLSQFIALISLLLLSNTFAEGKDRSCYCKIEVANEKTPVRLTHFNDITACKEHLNEKKYMDFWRPICSEESTTATLSCAGGADEVEVEVECVSRTKHHNYLLFSSDAQPPKVESLFSYHNSAKFNLRKSFSYLTHFLERNSGLDQSNSLYGGIYEQGTNYRIDLTILDFYLQLEDLLDKDKYSSFKQTLQEIAQEDPIKNFSKIYHWLDREMLKSRSLRRRIKYATPLIYTQEGLAIVPNVSIVNHHNIFSPRKNRKIDLYNKIIKSKNKTAIFKRLKSDFYPDLNTPFTVELLSNKDKSDLKDVIRKVHWEEHLKRVKQFNIGNDNYQYIFKMNSKGDSILSEVILENPPAKEIDKTKIDIFNYIHNNLHPEFLKKIFHGKVSTHVSLDRVTPLVVANNFEFWEDVVQEDSWARHITQGNDTILLIFRDWLKKNQKEVLKNLDKSQLDEEAQKELSKWKTGRRPKRGLTLIIYPLLEDSFPERPWEKHFILNSNGEKFVLGEKKLKRTMRTIFGRLKSIAKIENIASAAVATGVMAVSANSYASAAASTLVHDFITAKRYGYEIDDYMLKNTPANLLSALIFSTGFTPGRTADAIFRGATNGALQSLLTGSSVKLGMIVGGLSGGALHKLPPEFSNWVVPGENKNTLNIFSELAEQAFFKGINGAVVGYYEDGDWKKGLKKGALYGAGSAAVKIAIFGVRYDANAYISDEEIAEYNELHNHECGYYHGEYLERETSVMTERYGQEIHVNRDDIKRAQFRRDGILMNGRPDSTLGTNFSSPFGSEIGMAEGFLDREETILHEVMHTRQMQQGRMLNILNRLGPNSVPEGFWEEYRNVGEATLPKGYYRTFLYVNLEGDLAS